MQGEGACRGVDEGSNGYRRAWVSREMVEARPVTLSQTRSEEAPGQLSATGRTLPQHSGQGDAQSAPLFLSSFSSGLSNSQPQGLPSPAGRFSLSFPMSKCCLKSGWGWGWQAALSLNPAILETFRAGLGCRPHPRVGDNLTQGCLFTGPEQVEVRLKEVRSA